MFGYLETLPRTYKWEYAMTTESVRVGQLKKNLRIFHAGGSTGTIEVNCQNLKETKSKNRTQAKRKLKKKNLL